MLEILPPGDTSVFEKVVFPRKTRVSLLQQAYRPVIADAQTDTLHGAHRPPMGWYGNPGHE